MIRVGVNAWVGGVCVLLSEVDVADSRTVRLAIDEARAHELVRALAVLSADLTTELERLARGRGGAGQKGGGR